MNRQPGSERLQAGKNKKGKIPKPRRTPVAIPNTVQAMPVQIGGATLVPHTVLDAISVTNSFFVVQCLEPLEIFTGIETSNRYIVQDMFLRPLLYCNEKSGFLSRQCCGNGRSFVMEMRDIYGAPFMTAKRQQDICGCSDTLETAFMGSQIGVIQKECCDGQFSVSAAGCNQPIKVTSPSCCSFCCNGTKVFPVHTLGGGRLGDIVRLYPGFLQEFFTDADSYLVHFPANMPPIFKLLLISAVFLIDFTYFEEDE